MTIFVENDATLVSEYYYRRLWLAVRNKELHRREWLDELANAFRDADPKYEFLWQSGAHFTLPEIDDVFPDSDMRWISNYVLSDVCGEKPKVRSSKIERLRLFDLYFKIKHPRIAAHFYK